MAITPVHIASWALGGFYFSLMPAVVGVATGVLSGMFGIGGAVVSTPAIRVPEGSDVELDVIAVGAHPDDVEIACGGTLARLVRKGYQVGIVDLTDGEPTPHGTPEIRQRECEAATALAKP